MRLFSDSQKKRNLLNGSYLQAYIIQRFMEDFRNELKEKAQEMRRHFEQQRDEYIDGVAQMEEYLEMLDLIDKLTARNEKLEEEMESL